MTNELRRLVAVEMAMYSEVPTVKQAVQNALTASPASTDNLATLLYPSSPEGKAAVQKVLVVTELAHAEDITAGVHRIIRDRRGYRAL